MKTILLIIAALMAFSLPSYAIPVNERDAIIGQLSTLSEGARLLATYNSYGERDLAYSLGYADGIALAAALVATSADEDSYDTLVARLRVYVNVELFLRTSFSSNVVQSGAYLGRAQGVAMAAALIGLYPR